MVITAREGCVGDNGNTALHVCIARASALCQLPVYPRLRSDTARLRRSDLFHVHLTQTLPCTCTSLQHLNVVKTTIALVFVESLILLTDSRHQCDMVDDVVCVVCRSVFPISNMSVLQQQQQQQAHVVSLMTFVVVSAATHSWTTYVQCMSLSSWLLR